MFKFTCNNCKQSFNIEADNIQSKETVFCPNCETKISEGLLISLKNLSKFAQTSMVFENDKQIMPVWKIEINISTKE